MQALKWSKMPFVAALLVSAAAATSTALLLRPSAPIEGRELVFAMDELVTVESPGEVVDQGAPLAPIRQAIRPAERQVELPLRPNRQAGRLRSGDLPTDREPKTGEVNAETWTTTFSGAVLESEVDAPVAGAMVVARMGATPGIAAELTAVGEARCGADGRFEMEVVVTCQPPVPRWQLQRLDLAPLEIVPELYGWKAAVVPSVAALEAPNLATNDREILPRLGRTAAVDIEVVDAVTGQPVPGIELTLAPAGAEGVPVTFMTADSGWILTDQLGAGQYLVRVEGRMHFARPVEGLTLEVLPSTRSFARVSVRRQTIARGQLVDGVTGAPVALAPMSVSCAGRTRRFRSDAQGRFSPSFPDGGFGIVEVEAPGYAPLRLERLLSYGEDGGFGRVTMRPTGAVEISSEPVQLNGRVTDAASGLPIPGARVRLVGPNGEEKRFLSDARGRFSPLAFGRGAATFEVEASGFERLIRTLEVERSGAMSVSDLELSLAY
ncbi:MAG: carboxypeptidase-like regulatory domain-containing protein [Planctomycetota bacterium]